MNIAIIGYGRMGQSISRLINPKHELKLIVDINKPQKVQDGVIYLKKISEIDKGLLDKIDVFFEFTQPDSAKDNITELLKLKEGIKIVCGTTGWDTKSINDMVYKTKATLMISSNFSIGITSLIKPLQEISKSLANKGFKASIKDLHHKDKKDSPSGTAKMLAEIIEQQGFECPIESTREDDHVGTHVIRFESNLEVIKIKHKAKDRDVLAMGAIYGAEILKGQNRPGVYSFRELIEN